MVQRFVSLCHQVLPGLRGGGTCVRPGERAAALTWDVVGGPRMSPRFMKLMEIWFSVICVVLDLMTCSLILSAHNDVNDEILSCSCLNHLSKQLLTLFQRPTRAAATTAHPQNLNGLVCRESSHEDSRSADVFILAADKDGKCEVEAPMSNGG